MRKEERERVRGEKWERESDAKITRMMPSRWG
jgi:hypothetical protein